MKAVIEAAAAKKIADEEKPRKKVAEAVARAEEKRIADAENDKKKAASAMTQKQRKIEAAVAKKATKEERNLQLVRRRGCNP